MLGTVIRVLLACGPAGRQAPQPKIWHTKPVRAKDLALRRLIAQMIIVRVEGYFYSADNNYHLQLEQWVAEDQVGGRITFRGSGDGPFTNLQYLTRLAPVPLRVVSVTERGG